MIINRHKEYDSSLKREFSADKVSRIMVYRGAAITTDAIDLAAKNQIDIVYMDRMGKPIARTYSFQFEKGVHIWRNQMKASDNGLGMSLAMKIIEGKITNQAILLKKFAKTRSSDNLKHRSEKIRKTAHEIKKHDNLDLSRSSLMGIEGKASRQYFSALRKIIPENSYHGRRSKQPPEDLFNALLSYGYGILYTEVEKACIMAGLNPYFGFLHSDRPGRPSLVMDLIEEFRQPVVDSTVISLITKKIVNNGDIEPVKNGFYLNGPGKHKLVQSITSKLSGKIEYMNEERSISSIIALQGRNVVKYINGDIEDYSPFIYGR